ncbi:MAG TPA: glycosyltransferase [Flavobacterium sp.]|jgi:glycosyltransferase involved in cell wall biosynthesis
MVFCIITHVHHLRSNDNYFGYAPYINEMNIWIKNVDKVIIVAPVKDFKITAIHQNYNHHNIEFIAVPDFSLINFKAICKTILNLPKILFLIFRAIKMSTHIHLRCPGNMGLLGSIIQILFPKKDKTAKYAGNWDPNTKQPLSYRFQKYILSNTFLTKNMQVLVYGEWNGITKNIKPFFTATYYESDKIPVKDKDTLGPVKFAFVGTLSIGKQPLYAVQLVEALINKKYQVMLELYGEGNQCNILEDYIINKNLSPFIFLKGNQNRDTLKKAYQESHFVILPSKSEGWPKVIAEGMFWGCIPIATKVSCVPYMMDYGQRGILLSMDMAADVIQMETLMHDHKELEAKRQKAIAWSRDFTLDVFEKEIKQLMQV